MTRLIDLSESFFFLCGVVVIERARVREDVPVSFRGMRYTLILRVNLTEV